MKVISPLFSLIRLLELSVVLHQSANQVYTTSLIDKRHMAVAGEEAGDAALDVILKQLWADAKVQIRPPTEQQPYSWNEIRLFISSSFIDTQGERDVLIKRVIPKLNRQLAHRFITIVPVDLRWGVLYEESKDYQSIQKSCMNQIDRCRKRINEHPWFLGLRTKRYGWVQTELLQRDGYEHPDLFDWVQKLEEHSKHLSITSLECIHATAPPESAPPSPTVFFFERTITNEQEIEENMKWVFELEFVPVNKELNEEVELQYTKSNDAPIYKADKDNLNKFLKNNQHVKYSSYTCPYKKGGALLTGLKGKKKFGVGYVEDLEQFEELVETQLMEAIDRNFAPVDMSSVPEHLMANIPYANAARLKASSFVGRTALLESCYDFCTSTECDQHLMIIHGEPGCGKSALMSALSIRCLDQMQEQMDAFVFVHAADAYPGSNSLESMLKRLHQSLSKYCEEIDGFPTHDVDYILINLKSSHVRMLEETAREHPDQMFVILIDAVNQLHDSFLAWNMWWLPSEEAPPNLRFVISTLNKENGTFENACTASPMAAKVPLENMTYEEASEMVSSILARYKKKLTTTDDAFLGNQMDSLLQKNLSPLYLTAATHALRTFGIYEKMKEFIEDLPPTIPTLFQFLFENWKKVYGEKFVSDVICLIAISKDGLHENEINDITTFIEETSGIDYQCSFSRFYESLVEFLAAGGGGYLRFFHDQVTKVVLSSPPSDIKEMHSHLVQFYLAIIKPQLMEQPFSQPPTYYNHCLREVVHHQLQAGLDADFTDTLCNVYFIREQVKYEQQDVLHHDYLSAINKTKEKEIKKVLRQWSKFAQLYGPYIRQFPHLVYAMAMNQRPSSRVAHDTKKFPKPECVESYPVFWNNIPDADDPVLMKYLSERCYVGVHSNELNLTCVGLQDGRVCVYEANSGILHHDLESEEGETVGCLYISERFHTVWVGSTILVGFNLKSGAEEWSHDIECGKWMDGTGKLVFIGKNKEMIVYDEERVEIVNKWSLESCSAFSLNRSKDFIYTGHKGQIKMWGLAGELIRSVEFGTQVIGAIDSHPLMSDLVAILQDSCTKQVDLSSGEELWSIDDTNGWANVFYDEHGARVVSLNKDERSIMVYESRNGWLQNVLKGHADAIIGLRLVGGANEILTAGFDGSYLFTLLEKANADNVSQGCKVVVFWCGFLPHCDKYVTLSEAGRMQKWSASSGNCEKSVAVNGWEKFKGGAAIHPNGKYIFVYSGQLLVKLDTQNLEKLTSFTDPYPDIQKDHMKITADGLLCLMITSDTVRVLDISNPSSISAVTSTLIGQTVNSLDIHADSKQVVYGGEKNVSVWSLADGERLLSLPEDDEDVSLMHTMCVQFLYNPLRILYVDVIRHVHVMDMKGEIILDFKSDLSYFHFSSMTVMRNEILVTAESDKTLRFHDVGSGKILSRFINHRSEGFACLAVHPSKNILLGANNNGLMYLMGEDPMDFIPPT